MIKKWLIKRFFGFIIFFFVFFIVSLIVYSFISARTNISSLESNINSIRVIIGQGIFTNFMSNLTSLSEILIFQNIIFFISIVSFGALLWYVFRLYFIQRKNAIIDPLTELYNRRAIMFGLNKEIARSKRHQHDLSIAIVDIDYFKQYNDLVGHVEGDNALRRVANILKKNIRTGDTVGRIGGEEFLIVFPETDVNSAARVCEDLRKKVFSARFKGENNLPNGCLSISSGIAGISKGRVPKTTKFMEDADEKLYKSKSLGRNIVSY